VFPSRRLIAQWLSAALFATFLVAAPFAQSQAAAAVGDTDTALVLNGSNQYAEVTDPGTSIFDSTGTVTIEAWVYPTTTCPGSQGVAAKDVSYMIYCKVNKWAYAFSADGGAWTGNATSIDVEANVWHHIAFTHSATSTNLKVYYDGVNVETQTAYMPAAMTPNNYPFRIGTFLGGNYFQGKIDDVRVYNSQRSDGQILIDMKIWGPNTDPDLIAYYDFNDQSGSLVSNADATPAANSTLTLYNSPTYSNIESATVVNGDQVISFPRSYLTANGGWRIPSYTTSIQSLVIAGGGAGGSRAGGGGGAGGYVYDAALSVTPGSVQSVIVGQGGYGFAAKVPTNGLNSSLGSLRSTLGGGGGGYAAGSSNVVRAGRDGGSGGGASGDWQTAGSSAAYGLARQNSTFGYGIGFNGGSGYDGTSWPAGGGGGAGGVGANSDGPNGIGGKGGAGITDPIAGTSTCYATGAGGGVYVTYTGKSGQGGDCGGATLNTSPNRNAGGVGSGVLLPAIANTGSGGSGNGYNDGADAAGGNGASGVVILRYALNMSVSLSYSGGVSATYRTVGTITATGTLAGKVTFYERGKAIPGCVRASMNGSNVATCSWKPSLHGSTTVTATAKPSNIYVPNGSSALNIAVVARSGKR